MFIFQFFLITNLFKYLQQQSNYYLINILYSIMVVILLDFTMHFNFQEFIKIFILINYSKFLKKTIILEDYLELSNEFKLFILVELLKDFKNLI
jgi:hypothetical protein